MAAVSPAKPVRNVVDYDLLFDCVHCGLCLEACPTYAITRAEMDSPRGRIYLMKALADGRLELDADAARHLDLCLGCRGCETACPSGVHYGRLIEDARAYVESNYSRGPLDTLRRRLIGAIFPYPARLRALLAPLRLAEFAGLRPALEAILPRPVRAWLELLPSASRSSAVLPPPLMEPSSGAPTVAVHHGCVTQVLADSENINSERLLMAAGYRVAKVEPTVCCGALDLHSGNRERALKFARANVRAIMRSGADSVVSAASGCSAAIAEYGVLLKDDAELADDARIVAGKITEPSALLLASDRFSMPEYRCVVTYHDACHLAHGLGVREAPRRLLRTIPGLRLIELAEADMCCGSAGSYNLTEPAMARALAQRKAENIAATGADYVILGNPGCQFQIAAELRRRGAKTRVIHLSDFLAMVMNSANGHPR